MRFVERVLKSECRFGPAGMAGLEDGEGGGGGAAAPIPPGQAVGTPLRHQ